MRKARVVARKGVGGVYHCTSRVVDKARKFGPHEKARFLEFLRSYEAFCGVQILTYCVMSNHIHVLIRVPPTPDLLPDDAELVRLAARAQVSHGATRLERELAAFRASGDEAGRQKLRNKFLCRMWDVSKYMQSVKQRFTQWFNKLHGREGTLWEGRFRSVLVEDTEHTLAPMAAYADLNPVRAGMVEDPADYQWSGYSEAMRGGALALDGLRKVVLESLESPRAGETQAHEMERILARYRVYLFEKGEQRPPLPDGTGGRPGIRPERVEEVLRSGGRLSPAEALRCRNRYFTEGVVLGSEAFVEAMFEQYRGHFGPRRKRGARELHGVDMPGMAVIATLRKRALIPPMRT